MDGQTLHEIVIPGPTPDQIFRNDQGHMVLVLRENQKVAANWRYRAHVIIQGREVVKNKIN